MKEFCPPCVLLNIVKVSNWMNSHVSVRNTMGLDSLDRNVGMRVVAWVLGVCGEGEREGKEDSSMSVWFPDLI